MHRQAWDQGVVWAEPSHVYRALSDPAGYGAWWPGARASLDDGRVTLRIPGLPGLRVVTERLREGVGLFLRLEGDLSGNMEWYLEPFEEGTIVSCLVELEIPGGPRRSGRALRRLRAAVRRGMVGLKRALE
jgi:hypothetical protein